VRDQALLAQRVLFLGDPTRDGVKGHLGLIVQLHGAGLGGGLHRLREPGPHASDLFGERLLALPHWHENLLAHGQDGLDGRCRLLDRLLGLALVEQLLRLVYAVDEDPEGPIHLALERVDRRLHGLDDLAEVVAVELRLAASGGQAVLGGAQPHQRAEQDYGGRSLQRTPGVHGDAPSSTASIGTSNPIRRALWRTSRRRCGSSICAQAVRAPTGSPARIASAPTMSRCRSSTFCTCRGDLTVARVRLSCILASSSAPALIACVVSAN
jgi:hypothetical protein